jgi:hypothetical protein
MAVVIIKLDVSPERKITFGIAGTGEYAGRDVTVRLKRADHGGAFTDFTPEIVTDVSLPESSEFRTVVIDDTPELPADYHRIRLEVCGDAGDLLAEYENILPF